MARGKGRSVVPYKAEMVRTGGDLICTEQKRQNSNRHAQHQPSFSLSSKVRGIKRASKLSLSSFLLATGSVFTVQKRNRFGCAHG
jgi:hypothetical protein